MEKPRRRSKLDDGEELFGAPKQVQTYDAPPDQGSYVATPTNPAPPQRDAEPTETATGLPEVVAEPTPEAAPSAEVVVEQATEAPVAETRPAAPRRRRRGAPPPITRNARRLAVHGKATDNDLVSFNCKMTRGLRKAVKKYAADVEVDIQDVVAAALEDYLAERNIPFPGSDQPQPD